jgi:hypothetical protein
LTETAQKADVQGLATILDALYHCLHDDKGGGVDKKEAHDRQALLRLIATECRSGEMPLRQIIVALERVVGHIDIEDPGKPPSYEDLNQTALDQRKQRGGKPGPHPQPPLEPFRRSFPENGGLLASIAAYSYFIRYILWQWIYSYSLVSTAYLRPDCFQRTAKILAASDACLCVLLYAAEVRVLLGGTHRLKLATAAIHLVVYLALGVIFLADSIPLGNVTASMDLPFASTPVRVEVTLHSIYIAIVVILFLLKDIGLFAWTRGKGEHRFHVEQAQPLSWAAWTFRVLLYTVNWATVIIPLVLLTDFTAADQLSNAARRYFLPCGAAFGCCAVYNALLTLVEHIVSTVTTAHVRTPTWFSALVTEGQLGPPAVFWAFCYLAHHGVMTYWIVPGIIGVDHELCAGREWQRLPACHLAWILAWCSFGMVSIALFGVLYAVFSLVASVLVAFGRRIGEYHSLRDLEGQLTAGEARRLLTSALLGHLPHADAPTAAADQGGRAATQHEDVTAPQLFAAVVDGLVIEHKVSRSESAVLLRWFSRGTNVPRSGGLDSTAAGLHDPFPAAMKDPVEDEPMDVETEEAEHVLVTFFATLRSMPRHRGGCDVSSMPSFTFLVPHFHEPVFFTFHSMRAEPQVLNLSGVPSDVSYIASQLPYEWRLLVEDLKRQRLVAPDAAPRDLLDRYHDSCWRADVDHETRAMVTEVERWATLRGQTLARSMRGLASLRAGLLHMATLELKHQHAAHAKPLRGAELAKQANALVNSKMQVLVASQALAASACPVDAWRATHAGDIKRLRVPTCDTTQLFELQAAFPFIELVFPIELRDESTPRHAVRQLLRHARHECGLDYRIDMTDCVTPLCGSRPHIVATRHYSCHLRLASVDSRTRRYELHIVERPGPLLFGPVYRKMAPRGLMTQGKAENQFHAAQFGRGECFFTVDMNQDANITEGFKLPTMLHHYMGGGKDADGVATARPHFGIVGFTERTYTRSTSLAGELAGSAEVAFVTIIQRVLRSVLRIRMHYGHPDLFSGLLVRTIGFHKSSHGVNVSEDIFAGHECLARGVPIGFCEWLWFWKGRDTSLRLVGLFNNKIAEGAAQLVRSRDCHFLNANLDWITRSSLLFGTLGFYWTSVLLYSSIRAYVWALLLFSVGGVSQADLTSVGTVISVAWVFQLGYVMVIPSLVENVIEFGFISGVMRFFRYLLPSVFFHSFMLKVITDAFYNGLFTNAASYVGTGRGIDVFPIDPHSNFTAWAYSHYLPALDLLVAVVWFACVTELTSLEYFLRTVTVWVLLLSLLGGPAFFQCPPTRRELIASGKSLLRWLLRIDAEFGEGSAAYAELITSDGIEAAERRSYRTWFARRFAAPLYTASLRNFHALNFAEVMFSEVYYEAPAAVLLFAYIHRGMLASLAAIAVLMFQLLLLRVLLSGNPRIRRRATRIFCCTVIVAVFAAWLWNLHHGVQFRQPALALLVVAYFARLAWLLLWTAATAGGRVENFVNAGMNIAVAKLPNAVIAAVLSYSIAWFTTNVLRRALITWNCSARLAEEFRLLEVRQRRGSMRHGANAFGVEGDPSDQHDNTILHTSEG